MGLLKNIFVVAILAIYTNSAPTNEWVKILVANTTNQLALTKYEKNVTVDSYLGSVMQHWKLGIQNDGTVLIADHSGQYVTVNGNCEDGASLVVAPNFSPIKSNFYFNADQTITPQCNLILNLAFKEPDILELSTKAPELSIKFNITPVVSEMDFF